LTEGVPCADQDVPCRQKANPMFGWHLTDRHHLPAPHQRPWLSRTRNPQTHEIDPLLSTKRHIGLGLISHALQGVAHLSGSSAFGAVHLIAHVSQCLAEHCCRGRHSGTHCIPGESDAGVFGETWPTGMIPRATRKSAGSVYLSYGPRAISLSMTVGIFSR